MNVEACCVFSACVVVTELHQFISRSGAVLYPFLNVLLCLFCVALESGLQACRRSDLEIALEGFSVINRTELALESFNLVYVFATILPEGLPSVFAVCLLLGSRGVLRYF